jgi:cell division protease FtsH
MQWPPAKVQALFASFQQSSQAWETDYSKLLVFVCGNLDEVYHETAQRVEDCDTDADIFHRLTRKLSLIDVKKALGDRFKPEQIARLGNEHVVYPSFSKATYERLIHNLCTRYVDDIAAQCGVRFAIGQDVLSELYANAVFPAQGTRPLFSSVHAILSANLVNAALWVVQEQLSMDQEFAIHLAPDKRHLLVSGEGPEGAVQVAFAVTLELNRLKQRANADFRALLAVHEAGHGLAYCVLFGHAPQEVKINIASFEGGYNSFSSLKATTRQNALDMMCVGLAGDGRGSALHPPPWLWRAAGPHRCHRGDGQPCQHRHRPEQRGHRGADAATIPARPGAADHAPRGTGAHGGRLAGTRHHRPCGDGRAAPGLRHCAGTPLG